MSGNTSEQNPEAPSVQGEKETTQTQTQSQQQPPVMQEQATSDQPQVRGGKAAPEDKQDIPIPPGATPGPLEQAQWLPLPVGGMRALVIQLHPDDRNDAAKMQEHLDNLFLMNRDVVRDVDSHQVGAQVRIK